MLPQRHHVRLLSRYVLPLRVEEVARCSADGVDEVGRAMPAAAGFVIFEKPRHVENWVSRVNPDPVEGDEVLD